VRVFSYASERMLLLFVFNGFNPPLITFNNQLRTGADKGNPVEIPGLGWGSVH